MDKKQSEAGLLSVLKQVFNGYNENDNNDSNVAYETGTVINRAIHPDEVDTAGTKLSAAAGTGLIRHLLPEDRQARYAIYQEMARTELVDSAIQMHIGHALSPDMETGNIIEIESTAPEYEAMAKEINQDLGELINHNVASWAYMMCIYGVHYVRPFGEQGVGVTDIESTYYTLAKHIKEYVRGDRLSGFTSEHLKEKDGKNIRLAEPWALVPIKIPFWSPDLDVEPENVSGVKPSLYTDLHRRVPVETQNYGRSLLESVYTPWAELIESLSSLRGSRFNASRIDRYIAVAMEGLDPISSSNYLNRISGQMRKDEEAELKRINRKGLIPTVWNKILPVLAGKGGVTIDTQQVSPDINGIEDVMFNLKRFCSAVGIDPSMMGWSDLMQGGLGEGGWARTSIIAAMRANWIRIGVRIAVMRLIDIHLAYKYKKAFPKGKSPFVVKFHSINTALAIEKADELQSKADYATAVATVLDMINQGSLKGSKTFKESTMSQLGYSDDDIELILKELEDAKSDEGEGMFESLKTGSLEDRLERLVQKHLNDLFAGQE